MTISFYEVVSFPLVSRHDNLHFFIFFFLEADIFLTVLPGFSVLISFLNPPSFLPEEWLQKLEFVKLFYIKKFYF